MLSARLRRWSAWAPGLTAPEQWSAWAAAPTPLEGEEHADAKFLPAMLRRRCTPLTRAMLTAAYACTNEKQRVCARTVFASRHGSINESIDLLEAIVANDRISPAKFSHTVHNAQAGLFSIAAGNREASSSLSGMSDTFACAWLEVLAHLDREPRRPVLLVIGDVPLAETFAPLVDEPRLAYALALLLARGDAGDEIGFEHSAAPEFEGRAPWPDALEFLRWYLAREPAFTLGCWRWKRAG